MRRLSVLLYHGLAGTAADDVFWRSCLRFDSYELATCLPVPFNELVVRRPQLTRSRSKRRIVPATRRPGTGVSAWRRTRTWYSTLIYHKTRLASSRQNRDVVAAAYGGVLVGDTCANAVQDAGVSTGLHGGDGIRLGDRRRSAFSCRGATPRDITGCLQRLFNGCCTLRAYLLLQTYVYFCLYWRCACGCGWPIPCGATQHLGLSRHGMPVGLALCDCGLSISAAELGC